MYEILTLDGGGARGVMQMKALVALERETGRPTWQLFDLIIGTSVGSINAAMLAMGTHTAAELLDVMMETVPKVFSRTWFKKFKYSKAPLRETMNRLWPGAHMRDVKTRLIVTAYEDTEGREHFFKSWETKDGRISLFDAVDRSSAAPLYFGQVVDRAAARVWLDGGVGVFNNPSQYAYVEALRSGWGDVVCFSLGCGHACHSRTFLEASRESKIGGVFNFIDPKDGGLARRNSAANAARFCDSVEGPNWKHVRMDRVIPKKLDAMDKVRYLPQYCELGESMGRELVGEYRAAR